MKNLFFGLAVAVVALSASAFTNAKSTSLASPFLVQSVADQFRPITTEPTDSQCSGSAALQCYYECVPGKTLPYPANGTYYTPSEINTYLLSGIIIAEPSSFPSLYIP